MLLLYKLLGFKFTTYAKFKNISCYYYIMTVQQQGLGILDLKTSHVTII